MANLLDLAVNEVNSTRAVITSITSDNAGSNLTMFNKLGAKLSDPNDIKTTLNIKNCMGEFIHVVIDPSHAIPP